MRITTVLLSVTLAAASSPGLDAADVMFVTSARGEGALATWPQSDGLSGIAGANRICQNLAAAAGLDHPTTFQAWLSDSGTDAVCNIRGRSGHPPFCGSVQARNPGPWVRTDDAPFARNVDALARGEILAAPLLDENGDELDASEYQLVWTGTGESGTLSDAGHLCGFPGGPAWSVAGDVPGDAGAAQFGTRRWTALTELGAFRCSIPAHLYCFQLSLLGGPPLETLESSGALIFHTSTLHSGNLGLAAEAGGETGVAASTRICQARAAGGGLPDPASFHAWISTESANAVDLLGSAGPFKRPDGIQVASSTADLTDGELHVPIAETELLTYVGGEVWTGSSDSGAASSGHTCADWESAEAGLQGSEGFSSNVARWSAEDWLSCASAKALYCVSSTPVLFWTNFEENGGPWRWSATVNN